MSDGLDHVTTVPISEEFATTFAIGEEVTTQALGEEHPTTIDAEGPAELAPSEMARRGGPFGAY